jgi:CubicO group peptidase (beta-lactamase class C family)
MAAMAALGASGPVRAVLPAGAHSIVFTPGRTLRAGDAATAGLRPAYLARLRADLTAHLRPMPDHPDHPAYAGAVVLAARDGTVALHTAVGSAVRYADAGGTPVDLPPWERTPMRPDTIVDIASLTKLFTTVAVLREVDRGAVGLDVPVARYLPEFALNGSVGTGFGTGFVGAGRASVTVRQLLTHTSGLVEDVDLSGYGSRAAALAAALAAPLEPGMRPGGQYHYSDVGLIAAGALVERVTGRRLDDVVRTEITGPLGMLDTGYLPSAGVRDRIAATEYRPGVGILRGVAHDENVAPLGGVAGHAGMFSTARDLAVFCQMLLDGGRYGTARILREDTVRAMLVNANSRFPGDDHGLGVDLDQPWYMGPLASPVSFGHTGFTGTSVVVDARYGTILVLLTNQVHPDRMWSTKTPARNVVRRTVAADLSAAIVPR